MKNVAIIGLGKSGLSACRYLRQKGFEIWACDDYAKNLELDESVHVIESSELDQLIEKRILSFMIISPGVRLSHPLVRKAAMHGLEVFCDIEYAFRELKQASVPICGITGTNGKTTTTLLTSFIMNHAGHAAKAVGNIGVPLLDEIKDENEAHFVLELSSFQLQTIHTPLLQAAVLLNISPNHLDHHSDMEEYIRAKQHIGNIIDSGGALFMQEKSFRAYSWDHTKCQIFRFGFTPACEVFGDGERIIRFGAHEEDLPKSLQGVFSHDAENFLAAYALCRHIGISPKQCVDAYANFRKPPHRLQLVRSFHGVTFYDDSKATNVEAVVKAVESLQENVILIAGGVHKGYPYHAWKSAFPGKVKKMLLIGEAACHMENDLVGSVPTERCGSLEEAVKKAADAANPGDKVLLSPGCSSFDMFSCFEDRGRKFQELVNRL